MNEAAFAATTVFAFGFLSGLAVAAAVRWSDRVRAHPSRDSVALRLRAVRRSRVAVVEQRLAALEHALASARVSAERRGRPHQPSRPTADPDALEALLALGYRRTEAVAFLAAVPDAVRSTEDRVAAVLRASGSPR
jgi:hypothetical protein